MHLAPHIVFSKSKGRVVPVLKEIPHHEDAWGSGGVAPYILNLSIRWT
jgi:hypothetical protein